MYRRSDSLLYVLTDRACMSWMAFRGMFDYLDAQALVFRSGPAEELRYRRRRTVRALEALGHAEFDFDGDRTAIVAPSVFARLPQAGLPQMVLAGARSPDAIDQVRGAVRELDRRAWMSVSPQVATLPLVPARVVVQGESVEVLHTVARGLGIRYEANPPAWTIPHFAASIEEYASSRTWSTARELNWERTDFDPRELRFDTIRQTSRGLSLSRYRDRDRGTTTHVLWQDESGANVDPDWGRYAVLKELGHQVLLFDARRFILAVPSGTPLPRLLARALALSSGFAPGFAAAGGLGARNPERWSFELFRSVPPKVAEAVAGRLGQHLQQRKFDQTDEGGAT